MGQAAAHNRLHTNEIAYGGSMQNRIHRELGGRWAGLGRARGRRPWLSCGLALLLIVGAAGGARAEDLADLTGEAERVAPDSPQRALTQFLELCRDGRYADAARFLTLSSELAGRGPELARRLKLVLDRHVWIDLSSISPLSSGATGDGLGANVDEVAKIPGAVGGVDESVRMVRAGEGEYAWRFTRSTVQRVDAWYARLPHGWLNDNLPTVLTRAGPLNILWWQWLALPILIALSGFLGWFFAERTRRVLERLAKRSAARWDDEVLTRISGPLILGWMLLLLRLSLPWLGLNAGAEELSHRWTRGGFFVVFFWALFRTVDVGRDLIARSSWGLTHSASRSLLPLGARVSKVMLFVIAAVAMLAEFGYPVASLLAGLGIGGLALALAAQKTVENLFGAFSIGADQPFREGDFVKVEDFVGTVEAIGLRSTRFRTLDRTMISLPNGKLADMRLESFATRDRIRLACVVGLVYETTAAQMRSVLAGLEGVLRGHPKIWPDAVVVRFKELGASSLDIEVMAWFQTPDWGEFQLIRQEILLSFMETVEKAGTSFAFPTQTLHLVSGGGEPTPRRERGEARSEPSLAASSSAG